MTAPCKGQQHETRNATIHHGIGTLLEAPAAILIILKNIGKDMILPSSLYISTRNGSFAAKGRRKPFHLEF
ncbi:hypothetical protein BBD42_28200 [Paenibacillus sp. BIHB 4019]|uniref:Uncharacterized protein n=1 Tax=Paenibacillus sp. BIHB 4019 TaxID=1870819 RepID=A0A1B2DQG5_9BACL|nr:hypothetical protein BBD42_28200 [Paenibacillus sp. BIHB 4019]